MVETRRQVTKATETTFAALSGPSCEVRRVLQELAKAPRNSHREELLMLGAHVQRLIADLQERASPRDSVKNWWGRAAEESQTELREAWREGYHEYRGTLNTQLGKLRAQ
jgi:hypothetical protein